METKRALFIDCDDMCLMDDQWKYVYEREMLMSVERNWLRQSSDGEIEIASRKEALILQARHDDKGSRKAVVERFQQLSDKHQKFDIIYLFCCSRDEEMTKAVREILLMTSNVSQYVVMVMCDLPQAADIFATLSVSNITYDIEWLEDHAYHCDNMKHKLMSFLNEKK